MREDVEQLAEQVLSRVPDWIWDGETLPVPVDDIADSCFCLHVRDVDDLAAAPGAPAIGGSQSLSGLLLPTLGEIWVNASEAREWPPRRRFTIGHELGHWCMHTGEGEAVYCRSTSVAEREATPAVPPAEEEANAFAAALLMPSRLLSREYEREPRDFWQLCERFGVSGAAMGRRLHAVI
jgi:hypothetical protein